MKSLLSVGDVTRPALDRILDRAAALAEGNTEKGLSRRMVATMFFEPSTRTRLSFELATRSLGGEVLSFQSAGSSQTKGETDRDTVLTLAAMGPEIIVVRHATRGFPAQVREWTGAAVVNGGDGDGEHPTQAIGDAVTLSRHFGSLEGLTMLIVGDIAHSRVARSLIGLMPSLGVDVSVAGPPQLIPPELARRSPQDIDRVLTEVDVVYLLRVQRERGAEVGDDYHRRWGLGPGRAAAMAPDAVVMHPGPINRGVEIADEVADGPRSLILSQVSNGLYARMAVLAEMAGSLP